MVLTFFSGSTATLMAIWQRYLFQPSSNGETSWLQQAFTHRLAMRVLPAVVALVTYVIGRYAVRSSKS